MDDVDRTTERQADLDEMALRNVAALAAAAPVGHGGTCIKCGNDCERLMEAAYFKKKGRYVIADEIECAMKDDPAESGVCPPCRDKYHLP